MDTPLSLYLDRSDGQMDLENLPEQTRETGDDGFGSRSFGASPFGKGRGKSTEFLSRLYTPDLRSELDYRRVESDVGDWQVTIPGGYELNAWTDAEMAILDGSNETMLFRGFISEFDHSTADSTAKLSGPGVGEKLRRGSATKTYERVPAWEAFEDYVDEFLEDWTLDITGPTIETVFTDRKLATVESVRDDLEQATDINDTDPLRISDGALEARQTCFPKQGLDADQRLIGGSDDQDAGQISNTDYAEDEGVRLNNSGDYVDFIFEPTYTIPQIRVGIRLRSKNAPETELKIGDPDTGMESLGTVVREGKDRTLDWVDMREFGEEAQSISDLTRLRLETTTAPTTNDGFVDIDMIAPYDLRYDHSFVNTGTTGPDGVFHLDGPELYPNRLLFEGERADASRNIFAARMAADWDPNEVGERMWLSNDEELYQGEPNSNEIKVDFEDTTYGYGVTPRFALSRYGERDDATPRFGFKAQRLSGWEIWGDGNDLAVIQEEELDSTHLSNLQDLAGIAGMLFYIPHERPGSLSLVAFHPGQKQAFLDANENEVDEITTKRSTEGYANKVLVKGKRDEEGNRPTGTAQDDEEIEQRGGENTPDAVVTHVVIDATITNRTDAQNRAEQLLAEKVDEDEFSGTVTGYPVDVLEQHDLHPGIGYQLPRWDTYTALTELQVSDSGVDLDFRDAFDGFIEEVRSIRDRTDDAHKAQ